MNEMKAAQAGISAVQKAVDNVLESVPERLKVMLFDHFEFEGRQVPITRDEMTKLIKEMGKDLEATLRSSQPNSLAPSAPNPPQQQLRGGQENSDGFRRWPHPDGTLRKVPVGWIPPKQCTLSAIFNLWIIGNHAERISPYSSLSPKDDFKSASHDEDERKKHKRLLDSLWSKMRGSMTLVLQIIGKTVRELRDMEAHEREKCFQHAHTELFRKINARLPANRRVLERSELSFVTIYERACEAGLNRRNAANEAA